MAKSPANSLTIQTNDDCMVSYHTQFKKDALQSIHENTGTSTIIDEADEIIDDDDTIVERAPAMKEKKIEKCAVNASTKLSPSEIVTLRKMNTTKGLSGLKNLGNTCYLNSLIQALYATEELRAALEDEKTYNQFMECYEKNLKYKVFKKLQKDRAKTLNVDTTDKDALFNVTVRRGDLEEKLKDELKTKSTTELFRDLFIHMSEKNRIVRPTSIKNKLAKLFSAFGGFGQHDSQEAFNFLVSEGIAEETRRKTCSVLRHPSSDLIALIKKKKKLVTISSDTMRSDKEREHATNMIKNMWLTHQKLYIEMEAFLFWRNYNKDNYSMASIMNGMTIDTIKCHGCNNTSARFDSFYTLLVPIPEGVRETTLEDCLECYSASEELSIKTENPYSCDVCKIQTDAKKTTCLYHAPNILAITLKRYAFAGHGRKKTTKVTFPERGLKLNKIMSEYHDFSDEYELYSVINQYGHLSGGHYIAYKKSPLNNMWYKHDDSSTYKIDEKEDLIDNLCNNGHPYMLFYKKVVHHDIDSDSDEVEDV